MFRYNLLMGKVEILPLCTFIILLFILHVRLKLDRTCMYDGASELKRNTSIHVVTSIVSSGIWFGK
jgi:hypothetical protein